MIRARTDQKLITRKYSNGAANSSNHARTAGATATRPGGTLKARPDDAFTASDYAFCKRAYSVRKSSYVAVVPSYSVGGTGCSRAFCMKLSRSE